MKENATKKHLIYVVDNDDAIRRLLSVILTANDCRVKQFSSGFEAVAAMALEQPDLIILDIMMPGWDGLETAKRIRQSSQVPILILSVRHEIPDKLAALDLGADDYVTKPFRPDELLARVRALLRRTSRVDTVAPQPRFTYKSGRLEVDLDGLRVISHNREVQLTPREWATLRVLVNHAGSVVTSRQLLHEVWGAAYEDQGEYVRTYITRLRRKLEPLPRHPRYILLERGLGYRIADAS